MGIVSETEKEIKKEDMEFFKKVYFWMFSGVMISWITAILLLKFHNIFQLEISSFILLVSLSGSIFIAMVTRAYYFEISFRKLLACFYIFNIFIGIAFAKLCLLFSITAVINIFAAVSIAFMIMSIYAHKTKKNLRVWEKSLFFSAVALFIMMSPFFSLNSFSGMETGISLFGVFVFGAGIAIYTQRIKIYNKLGNIGTKEDLKESLMGAFDLYIMTLLLFYFIIRIILKKK